MANFVLFTWPLIAIVLYASLGRERGLIWSVIVGYLFLPEAITFEIRGLPDYDKLLAISLGASLGMALFHHKPSFPMKLVLPQTRDYPREVAEIWAELLEMDPEEVPYDKSFQSLGGTTSRAQAAMRRMKDIGIKAKFAREIDKGATIADLTRVTPKDGPRRLAAPGLTVISYLLLGTLLFSTFMTMLTNSDALVAEVSVRPGLRFRDVVSMMAEPVIIMVPFLLALSVLRGRSHQMEVAKAIVIVGVFYAGLAAIEARLSPQFNVWIYGYFQHSWLQHLRDGYRPIVFLRHGLWLGFFLLTVVLTAFAMYRHTEDKSRYLYLLAGLWTLAVLAISRNLGVVLLTVVFLPLVVLAPRWIQVRVVMATVIFFLAYPAVWQSGLLPIERFVEFVASISEDRAQTFQFRLDNEAAMLSRAMERPLWGWGGWDRWRVFDEEGNDTTVADGIWIITLGERGWVGYVCFFGILTLPLMLLVRAMRREEKPHVIPAFGLLMAANLIYMIPNSTLSPIGWLINGTIAAYLRWHVVEVKLTEVEVDATRDAGRQRVGYTRFVRNHRRVSSGDVLSR